MLKVAPIASAPSGCRRLASTRGVPSTFLFRDGRRGPRGKGGLAGAVAFPEVAVEAFAVSFCGQVPTVFSSNRAFGQERRLSRGAATGSSTGGQMLAGRTISRIDPRCASEPAAFRRRRATRYRPPHSTACPEQRGNTLDERPLCPGYHSLARPKNRQPARSFFFKRGTPVR